MNQWNDQRQSLLKTLQNIGGADKAENEIWERIAFGFYPVTEHLRLLDPEVVLVVGPSGSGKTELVRILTNVNLYKAISRYATGIRLPSGASKWIVARPFGKDGLEVERLRSFMQSCGTTTETVRDLWFAHLVRTLKNELNEDERAGLDTLLTPQGAEIDAIATAFAELATRPVVALDRLDARLSCEDRYVFVTYDELDTLGAGDWTLIEAGVRGLVAFWAAYARRWKRIRAKVFLRTDFYEQYARDGGADLAKLAFTRVELVWSERDLYGLLLKRMANFDKKLADYVLSVKMIEWIDDPMLGKIPQLRKWQDAHPIIEHMVGTYMGTNQKKKLMSRWLIDQVRDSLDSALPRPFMRLIEEAARQELAHFESLRKPRLLEPVSLRRALDHISNFKRQSSCVKRSKVRKINNL